MASFQTSGSDVMLNYGVDWFSNTRRASREQEAANPDYIEPGYFWDRKSDVGAVAYPMGAEGRSFYVGIKAKIF